MRSGTTTNTEAAEKTSVAVSVSPSRCRPVQMRNDLPRSCRTLPPARISARSGPGADLGEIGRRSSGLDRGIRSCGRPDERRDHRGSMSPARTPVESRWRSPAVGQPSPVAAPFSACGPPPEFRHPRALAKSRRSSGPWTSRDGLTSGSSAGRSAPSPPSSPRSSCARSSGTRSRTSFRSPDGAAPFSANRLPPEWRPPLAACNFVGVAMDQERGVEPGRREVLDAADVVGPQHHHDGLGRGRRA